MNPCNDAWPHDLPLSYRSHLYVKFISSSYECDQTAQLPLQWALGSAVNQQIGIVAVAHNRKKTAIIPARLLTMTPEDGHQYRLGDACS